MTRERERGREGCSLLILLFFSGASYIISHPMQIAPGHLLGFFSFRREEFLSERKNQNLGFEAGGMKGFARIAWVVSLCAFVLLPLTTSGLPAGRKTNGLLVNLTILESAVSKGAVCLDGSPPAYNFAPGFGDGVNNWLVHFEGGGWCHNATNCLYRSRRGRLGSSKAMRTTSFNGILNDRMDLNPDFYNWNKIKIRYCDGSSYTGDVESVDLRTKLHYRGARIFLAVMEELLAKGMKKAQNALLSGCSAGGLASLLHCDRFHDMLPASARVKCLSDAGFFVNAKDISGAEYMRAFFKDIATTHNSVKHLPEACTSRLRPDMCFFPQYMVKHIQTPLFLLNSAYDSWQIRNVLVPPGSDPEGAWDACRSDISLCNTEQLQAMQGFREDFLKAMGRFGQRPSAGMFINSCFAHCQTELTRMWHAPNSPRLGNLTVADAVGEWFFDRGEFKKVDCPYPCDTSCQTMTYPNPRSRDPDHPQEHAGHAKDHSGDADQQHVIPESPGQERPAEISPDQLLLQDHKQIVRRDPGDQAPAAAPPRAEINPGQLPQDHKLVPPPADQAPAAAGVPEQEIKPAAARTPADHAPAAAGVPDQEIKPAAARTPADQAPAAADVPEQEIKPTAGRSPADQTHVAGAPEQEIKPAAGRSPVDQTPAAGVPDQEIKPAAGRSPTDQTPAAGAPDQEIKPAAGRSPADQTPAAGAPDQEIKPAVARSPADQAPAGSPAEDPSAGAPEQEIKSAAAQSPADQAPAGSPAEDPAGRSRDDGEPDRPRAPAGAPEERDAAEAPVEEDPEHPRYRNLDQPPEKIDLGEGKSSQEWQVKLKRHLFLLPASLFYLL